MLTPLQDKTVLVVGRGSGLAGAIVDLLLDNGAKLIAAGRNVDALTEVYAGTGVDVQSVDLTDDASIQALAARIGNIDHVVSTASARARGTIDELEREKILLSLDTKVIGPLMLAKYLRPKINPGGSIVLFSGHFAFRIKVGTLGVAITNGAADTLTRSLAVELGPIRVNAISPGTIDTGAWDALGEEGKANLFAELTANNPTRRIGESADIANAVLFCLTNTFLTGVTLQVDGGETLV
jgi:NAD(P)-dependent dehydrogenase (short-subunit alcohol dehydrogenase family)